LLSVYVALDLRFMLTESERNGFIDRLITSADAPGSGLSVPEVKARAERRILRRELRQGEPGFDSTPA
jgi:hypothetical protein